MLSYEGISTLFTILWIVITGTRISSFESFVRKDSLSQNKPQKKFQTSPHPNHQQICRSVRTPFISGLSFETTRLFSSENDDNSIRFLGKGPDAIVRPGVVLLAPVEEFHHYLRQSALFIYDMGTDDNDDYVIRGVILDNPTPFTIGEMMEKKESGGIYENLIFRGGEAGGQEAFCLHSVDALDLEEIGTSGVYQGGQLDKIEDRSKVKFFFNYMEFLEQELEDMLEIMHDGDGWASVEVPSSMVINSDYDKGEAWSKLRNMIRGNLNDISNETE